MDNGYSILMLCFSALLLLYAALLAVTKDHTMIPRNYGVEMKDPKKYAVQFSKVIALMAIPPFLSAVAAPSNMVFGFLVLIVCGAAMLWLGTKIMKNR